MTNPETPSPKDKVMVAPAAPTASDPVSASISAALKKVSDEAYDLIANALRKPKSRLTPAQYRKLMKEVENHLSSLPDGDLVEEFSVEVITPDEVLVVTYHPPIIEADRPATSQNPRILLHEDSKVRAGARLHAIFRGRERVCQVRVVGETTSRIETLDGPLLSAWIDNSILSQQIEEYSDRDNLARHPPFVPAGWKLVPLEETDEMIAAGAAARELHEHGEFGPTGWQARLDAAPQPPSYSMRVTGFRQNPLRVVLSSGQEAAVTQKLIDAFASPSSFGLPIMATDEEVARLARHVMEALLEICIEDDIDRAKQLASTALTTRPRQHSGDPND